MILRACIHMFKNYANFKGRTSRRDFWIAFFIFVVGDYILFKILDMTLTGTANTIASVANGFYILAIIVPYYAMIVRRVRDTGKPWYYVFYFFIPLAGIIILLVLLLLPSAEGELPPAPKKVKPHIPKNTLRR